MKNGQLVTVTQKVSIWKTFDTQVLSAILDDHAPIVTKQVPLRKREPWHSEEIKTARRTARAHERRLRKYVRHNNHSNEAYRTELSKAYNNSLDHWFQILDKSKQEYLSKTLNENRDDPKKLFRTMNGIMNRVKSYPLPEHQSAKEMANDFANYFKSKTDKIRESFDSGMDSAFCYDAGNEVKTPLLSFKSVSESDVHDIIFASGDKYCALDPLPTELLKKCGDILTPVITRIINLSFETSCVPMLYKQALITPLLKKPSLEKELGNYRPVSNLPYLSKLAEECAIRQVSNHMVSNGLGSGLTVCIQGRSQYGDGINTCF